MIIYRLSTANYITDLSGKGAEIAGGRWNTKGIPVLYTASSRALAVIEVAVHVPLGIIPTNYAMASIQLPDDASIHEIAIDALPPTWTKNPFIKETQQLGDSFIKAGKFLALKVPSASVAGDYNILLNPRHKDFREVQIVKTEAFEFDLRLFKKP
ncbi:RES domain-containing protein [Mucilaginibacter limnophilus]|uniref:RES domain-containing protein n=1 Tax=Mucilaginibacter limnophilus TaxID=1932778 RepID=A0A3S2Y2G8_9SPHI|nr:RES family NAD+ phosphorylase [Mucilaginibacter limnophilus]RVU01926.1 RES domain-containing protein [Mucilaginibacter limnophilus]